MDVGKGQKQTRCIDSPVRRRGGVECSENGVMLHIYGGHCPINGGHCPIGGHCPLSIYSI
jgi:hypothetical protein